jgi:predicted transcriptional regulator
MQKTIRVEDMNSFFRRLGKAPEEPVSAIIFASAEDLARAMTPGRRAILEAIKGRTMPVAELAAELGRDVCAISRDLDKLEELEMLANYYEPSLGHGRRRMVKSEFTEYLGVSENLQKLPNADSPDLPTDATFH